MWRIDHPLLALLLSAVALSSAPSCERADVPAKPSVPPGEVADNNADDGSGSGTASTKQPAVVFGESGARVLVDVVSTPGRIQRGLMYVKHLPPDRGMLFIMPEERVQSFWMKNTLIPLDMIFIDSSRRVAGVVENTEPMTTTSRSVGVPSRYVLEVNGGWTKQHGVTAGTSVQFENVAGLSGD